LQNKIFFRSGDHEDDKSLADEIAFMKEAVPMLDSNSAVFRYAWMSARTNDNRNLLETSDGKAQLTELGQLYNSL
jgi:hypothetical protein